MKEYNDETPYTNFDVSDKRNNNLTTQELIEYKKKQDLKDDAILLELKGQAKQIREGQQMINSVLKEQDQIVENVGQAFDKLEDKMQKENNKLKLYLEKSSTSCLYWTMIIELVILFLFFMI